jgi:hypothetical protein
MGLSTYQGCNFIESCFSTAAAAAPEKQDSKLLQNQNLLFF